MILDLNNENLRASLSVIYDVDPQYIVLRQGNWYNPVSTEGKPKTWIGYRILKNKPIMLPYYKEEAFLDEEENEYYANCLEIVKQAEIDLQFIGDKAEELANNIHIWLNRQDVGDELDKYDGKLMANDLAVYSTDYFLDGENTITAWNVKLNIVWIQKIKTGQIKFETVNIEGRINING
jgi:hypothetical protein